MVNIQIVGCESFLINFTILYSWALSFKCQAEIGRIMLLSMGVVFMPNMIIFEISEP